MAESINILFLGGAKRVSLAEAFQVSAKVLGKEVKIFSYELDRFVPIASIAEIIVGKKWDDAAVYEHLTEVIVKNNIHIVLPFVDPAIFICAQLKTKLSQVFIPVSDEAVCEAMFDKVKANAWFMQHEVPVPGSDGSFPMIAKPRKGSASKGLVVIKNQEELSAFKAAYKEENYLMQRYLDAEEFTVDAYVAKEKKILSIVPRKRLEVSAGESTRSITVKDIEIVDLSKRVLTLAAFRGPITLQFLREKGTGRLFIMEINPRFGGGVLTSIKAGADSTLMILKEYLKLPVELVLNWQENLIMTRAFREYYYHADNH